MNALVYHDAWRVSLEARPEPAPPEGTAALVRVRATGICGTDIGIVSGQYFAEPSVILGHESSGEVVAVGPEVQALQAGDRVVIDPTFHCGSCRLCRTARSNHCEHKTSTETGVSRDGTFAEYYDTDERFLYKIADDVSYEAATLTEPLSCALTGVDRVGARPDLRTLVLGAGPMGILYTHALSTRGISGKVVEISPARRDLAARVIPPQWSVAPSIGDAVPKDGQVDLVVDTTGELAGPSIPMLARGGRFLAVGLRPSLCEIDMRRVADESLAILGSIDSLGTFNAAAHMINTRVIPAEAIVTERMDLSDYEEAFRTLGCDFADRRQAYEAQALKITLRP